ncbi:MAG: YkvA family protein [Pleomorphochaeta sp.]
MEEENKRSIELASKLGDNVDEEQIINMEDKLPSMKRGPVVKIWDKVVDIYNGFKSDETPNSLKVLLIGSLLYLVLPVDVVPDFIPVGGLVDDVTVLTYVWTKFSKIMKLGAKISKPIINEGINSKIQESIKNGYNKAFEYAEKKLTEILKKKRNKIIKNCFINLAIFVIAILFLSNNTKESAMISSLIILILFVRSIYSFIKSFPLIHSFLKIFFKEKNIDSTVEIYLKNNYSFITPIEEFKNKLTVFDDIPDLKELIKMQRIALRKTIIEVSLTIILAIIMAFVFRRILIFNSEYSFFQLIKLPFISFINIF